MAAGRPPSFAVIGSETLLEEAFDDAGACTGLNQLLEEFGAGATGQISYLDLVPGDVGLVGASSES